MLERDWENFLSGNEVNTIVNPADELPGIRNSRMLDEGILRAERVGWIIRVGHRLREQTIENYQLEYTRFLSDLIKEEIRLCLWIRSEIVPRLVCLVMSP
jgi:hypothetical protein